MFADCAVSHVCVIWIYKLDQYLL